MEVIFGTLTLILAVAMTLLALPSQIYKNHKDKKCGLSTLMVFLPLLVYISRAIYAIVIKSYYILIPDILGVIFSLIVLWQYLKYGKAGLMKIKNVFLAEILKNYYLEEEIYAKDMRIIDNNKVAITFFFPSYKRAKRSISYASANQIVPAILEGLYAVAGNYVKNETNKPAEFKYEDFPKKMWDAIFREFDKMVFSKKIPKEEFVEMIFEITKTEKIRNFHIFHFQFSGPVKGKAKCIIPA